jgi:hypothetical protein
MMRLQLTWLGEPGPLISTKLTVPDRYYHCLVLYHLQHIP